MSAKKRSGKKNASRKRVSSKAETAPRRGKVSADGVLTWGEWKDRFYPVDAEGFYPRVKGEKKITFLRRVARAAKHSLLKWEGLHHASKNGYLCGDAGGGFYIPPAGSLTGVNTCALCAMFFSSSCQGCPLAVSSVTCLNPQSAYKHVMGASDSTSRTVAIEGVVGALKKAVLRASSDVRRHTRGRGGALMRAVLLASAGVRRHMRGTRAQIPARRR